MIAVENIDGFRDYEKKVKNCCCIEQSVQWLRREMIL